MTGSSPKLKPLLLPQLVEERRREEAEQDRQSLLYLQTTMAAMVTTANQTNGTAPSTSSSSSHVYCGVINSSSSDVTTPVTPTFSTRGHSRYGSSCSSLDLSVTLSATPCDSPCWPAPTAPTSFCNTGNPTAATTTIINANNTTTASAKRALPDVLEDPMEQDCSLHIDDVLYCLCDAACIHRDDMTTSISNDHHDDIYTPTSLNVDYNLACLSESDFGNRFSFAAKQQDPESALAGMATRLGSRFSNLARWRSGRRSGLTSSPTCELSLENAYPISLAASSRSSSVSGPSYSYTTPTAMHDRIPESTRTMPQLMSWQSIESIHSPDTGEATSMRNSIQRDRALATTPLLPPLMTAPPPEDELLSCPLELPAVAATAQVHSPVVKERTSTSSIFPSPLSPLSPITSPDMLSLHMMPPESDEWSDRLGHANFTILPEPYQPDLVDLESLRKFLADWDKARVCYTQHLLRTGEHYGTTGKIYVLTEAKWAEIEQRWTTIHATFLDQVRATAPPPCKLSHSPSQSTSSSSSSPPVSIDRSRSRSRSRVTSKRVSCNGKPSCDDDCIAGIEWRRIEQDLPMEICKMLEETDKFPGLSDNGIVGPMERDEVMAKSFGEERKRSKLWRSIVDKIRR